jgi:hypothetical protein
MPKVSKVIQQCLKCSKMSKMPKIKDLRALLSQAELAPTEMLLINTRPVGATFGCDSSYGGHRGPPY